MDIETMAMIIEAIEGYEDLLDSARSILGQEYLFEDPQEGTPMNKLYRLYSIVEKFSPLNNEQDESINKMYKIIWNRGLSYEERAKLVLGV